MGILFRAITIVINPANFKYTQIMNTDLIKKTMLFKGMQEDEIRTALKNLHAEEKEFQKNEIIFFSGNQTQKLGLILSGSVTIENNDIWGNRTILNNIGQAQVFAETYAILTGELLIVDAVANEYSHILFLNMECLQHINSASEPWTIKLLINLLTITAKKNLFLSNRSFHTAPKTILGKVMAYLNSVALHTGTQEFNIPFNRQQLADYLNVERSALSKELGKMQRDGLIKVNKNHFTIVR